MATALNAGRGFTSRKFIVVIVALVCFTVLAYSMIMPIELYADLVTWLLIAYMAVEGGGDAISRTKWARPTELMPPKDAPPPKP